MRTVKNQEAKGEGAKAICIHASYSAGVSGVVGRGAGYLEHNHAHL